MGSLGTISLFPSFNPPTFEKNLAALNVGCGSAFLAIPLSSSTRMLLASTAAQALARRQRQVVGAKPAGNSYLHHLACDRPGQSLEISASSEPPRSHPEIGRRLTVKRKPAPPLIFTNEEHAIHPRQSRITSPLSEVEEDIVTNVYVEVTGRSKASKKTRFLATTLQNTTQAGIRSGSFLTPNSQTNLANFDEIIADSKRSGSRKRSRLAHPPLKINVEVSKEKWDANPIPRRAASQRWKSRRIDL